MHQKIAGTAWSEDCWVVDHENLASAPRSGLSSLCDERIRSSVLLRRLADRERGRRHRGRHDHPARRVGGERWISGNYGVWRGRESGIADADRVRDELLDSLY